MPSPKHNNIIINNSVLECSSKCSGEGAYVFTLLTRKSCSLNKKQSNAEHNKHKLELTQGLRPRHPGLGACSIQKVIMFVSFSFSEETTFECMEEQIPRESRADEGAGVIQTFRPKMPKRVCKECRSAIRRVQKLSCCAQAILLL